MTRLAWPGFVAPLQLVTRLRSPCLPSSQPEAWVRSRFLRWHLAVTLLLTCAAAGVKTVFTAPSTAWCWSPKVLRAGMGAHFHLCIHEAVPWPDVRQRLRIPAIGTRASQAESLYRSELRAPCLWLFGSEGDGICAQVAADTDRWVRIPQAAGVESLNVAAAGALCLFEQRRQRGLLD